jgi:hypothetical protein
MKAFIGVVLAIALVVVVYLWAAPQLGPEINRGQDRLPPKVEIEMPNPGG